MLEATLRRDRAIMIGGLICISVLAWLYMLYLAWDMSHMNMAMDMAMPMMQPWTLSDFSLTFIMWAVMMVAMMVPSAAPMVLTYGETQRRNHASSRPFGPTTLFLMGYIIVWVGFSLIATTAQWFLHRAALLSPMMVTTSTILGSSLLILAGVFQFTPFKQACLHHCRTPFAFFLNEWRDGPGGAFVMGLKHGSYCLGCCWFLMALLFVAGVMNLVWVATLAVLVLLEKVTPFGTMLSKILGVLFVVWGLWLLSSI